MREDGILPYTLSVNFVATVSHLVSISHFAALATNNSQGCWINVVVPSVRGIL